MTSRGRFPSRIPAVLLLGSRLLLGAGPEWPPESSDEVAPGVRRVGRIALPRLVEASGLVLSRNRPDTFWCHNDGNRPYLIAFDHQARLVQDVEVCGFTPQDFEDIAADGSGHLYLSDTGDNAETRGLVRVARIAEPGPGEIRVCVERTWTLRWPDGARDAESLFVHAGYGWLISKVRFAGETTRLMRFPLDSTSEVVTLEDVGELAVDSPAAGADLSADGTRLAVITRAGAFVWELSGNPADAVRQTPLRVAFDFGLKNEGAAFVPQGLLVAAESNELHLFTGRDFVPDPGGLRFRSVRRDGPTLRLGWQGVQGRVYTLESAATPGPTAAWIPLRRIVGAGAAGSIALEPTGGTDFLRIRE